MTEYLQTTIDKFTFRVAKGRFYSSDGFWLQHEADRRVRLGVSDFLQQRSGDVTFVTVKAAGTGFKSGDELVDFETIKVILVLHSPIDGVVIEANPALASMPEVVNQDPYGKGWLALIEPTNWETDRAKLLKADGYFAVMQSQIEEEVKRS